MRANLTAANIRSVCRRPWAIVALAFVAASTAEAQPAIGVALERYATIHGAVLLEQKCKYFAPNLRAEFQAHVQLIRISLQMAIGNPSIFATIEKGSQTTVDSEKYASCPKDAENIAIDALLVAKDWSLAIRRAAVEGAAQAGRSSTPTKPILPQGSSQ